jgi:beta-N-acetylglucosaminidase
MDPANFMTNAIYKYMFMKLDYVEVDTAVLNQMLAGKGILDGMGETIKNVAKLKNVNPFYVAAHTILETGNGTSVLAQGVEVKELHATFGDSESAVTILDAPATVYNMFGIGAWDSNPVLWGSEKAYKEGWVTPELAIAGGIAWIADGYINHSTFKQDTLYKMRYRLVDSGTIHQYATDIAWHYKQARILEREFSKLTNLPRLEFEVPRFKAE